MNDRPGTVSVGIETLESRTFLSAAPVHAAISHAAKPAVKTKLVIPNLKGIAYQGTITYNGSAAENVGVTASTETKGGALKVLLYVNSGETTVTYHMAGVVTLKHKLTLAGHVGKEVLNITGTVSSDLSSISGRLAAHVGRSHAAYIFSVTRVTASN